MSPFIIDIYFLLAITIVRASPVIKNGIPVVKFRSATIRGVPTPTSNNFFGLPYASPPVRSLRWKAPKPHKGLKIIEYNATKVKPGCPQYGCDWEDICPLTTSEDCLYLNVFTPVGSPDRPSGWPVMFYIIGGSFSSLSAGAPLFHGTYLAEMNVIVVTHNYRLGALGFLKTEEEKFASGNYGLLDQQMALKWVHRNIQFFGGDPSSVTLFGDSAGGQSVIFHLSNNISDPLFSRAIVQSAPVSLPYVKHNDAIKLSNALIEFLGCTKNNINCMRSRTAKQIAHASAVVPHIIYPFYSFRIGEPWGPFLDGEINTDIPFSQSKNDQYAKKPLIIGTTSAEAAIYIYTIFKERFGTLLYLALLLSNLTFAPHFALRHYYPIFGNDQRKRLEEIISDALFVCSSRKLAQSLVNRGHGDVWLYVFDFVSPRSEDYCSGYACHGIDAIYRFRTLQHKYNPTANDMYISTLMMNLWTNFAKTGDPNKSDEFHNLRSPGIHVHSVRRWPRYGKNGKWKAFYFKKPPCKLIEDFRGSYCDKVWEKIKFDIS